MKRIYFAMLLSALICTGCKPSTAPAIAVDRDIEAKVANTLKRMTLDEKVGQMCELTIEVLADESSTPENFVMSEQALKTVIGEYKVGSILNVPMDRAVTKEKWTEVITRIQEASMEYIGIPDVYGVDQNHGASYTVGATFFPQELNQGATFNRDLVAKANEISAYESRACNIPWLYNPVLDQARDPRWPRFWENYGESEFLNAAMGVVAVKALQGDDPNHIDRNHVAVSLKHYLGYGSPVSGKDRTPSMIPDHVMYEKFFTPFKAAIEAGALTVMVNSANNGGIPFHANYKFLTEWLKEGLNWDGMIVTDWADILNLCTRDRIAKDHKDAIRMAINAGIDMSMVTYTPEFCTLLKELVEEGAVKMSRIDDAVARILRLKYRLGLFEEPSWPCEDYDKFACEEFAEQAVEAARQSIVLLKNDNGILPIKEGTRILVTGPNANSMRCLNGGWSYTWQGHLGILPEYTEQYNTIYEALCNRFGAANVKYVPGVTYNESGLYWEENEPDIQAAVAAAASVDCIVVCVGENSYCETPGNLSDLALSENQRNLVKALAKSGKPIVMVLNEGRPRIIRDIVDCAGAIVDVMLPGNYGGDALSELLAGDCNFSGRLPFTYPKEPASLINYDYKPCENINGEMEGSYNYSASAVWQWGFGFGLSYTNFEYSALRCDKVKFNEGDVLNFKVDVKNAGKVAGYESVLLFASDLVATYTPDNRRLREFAKIWLEPGESKTVELSIKASDLAYVNEALEWVLEPGEFKIAVGTESIVIENI